MSESKHGLALRELEELSALGANCAANALGLILGRDVVASAPRQAEGGRYRPSVNWSTGVIFEADGILSGLVAILLPGLSPATLAALVVGERQDEVIESALRELGNIVASHTVSAIADDLGGTILLSVPTLVMDGADRFLVTLAGERQAVHCFESDLFTSDGERVAALVFAPEFAAAKQNA